MKSFSEPLKNNSLPWRRLAHKYSGLNDARGTGAQAFPGLAGPNVLNVLFS